MLITCEPWLARIVWLVLVRLPAHGGTENSRDGLKMTRAAEIAPLSRNREKHHFFRFGGAV